MPKQPATTSPSKRLVTELPPPSDLGDPLSDEDDTAAYNRAEPLSPVPDVVHTWSADTDVVVKSEPMDDVEGLASDSHLSLPLQLVEHSYSYTDHIGVCPGYQFENLQTTEDESASRTTGRKWGGDDDSSRHAGDCGDRQGYDVVVRMRKKCAPLITSRLIIPVVRVARSALSDKNVMENAGNEMDVVHNSLDRHYHPTG